MWQNSTGVVVGAFECLRVKCLSHRKEWFPLTGKKIVDADLYDLPRE